MRALRRHVAEFWLSHASVHRLSVMEKSSMGHPKPRSLVACKPGSSALQGLIRFGSPVEGGL